MEDYIKAIYAIERDAGGRVSTSALAEALEVTPPTASSMTERLAERGLVHREEYRGVTLTDEGEVVALELLRHHRLLESFLAEHLDFDWSAVHDEADRLEHHISEELERRIAAALDDPGVDPHGDPIPSADLELPDSEERWCLDDVEAGEHVVIQRVGQQDEASLDYLAAAGIRPGTELELVDVAPIDMITVRTPDGEQQLPTDVARTIEVAASDA